MQSSRLQALAAMAILVMLSGCVVRDAPKILSALDYAPPAGKEGDEGADTNADAGPSTMRVSKPPSPRLNRIITERGAGELPGLEGPAVGVSLDSVPLTTFINVVFGDILKVDFEIASSLVDKREVITLRTAEDRPPEEFLNMVVKVLENYGVGLRYDGDMFRIFADTKGQAQIPTIIRSRAFIDVPGELRPIFQVVPIGHVRSQALIGWLQTAFGNKVRAQPMGGANAVILLGTRNDVMAALDAIEVLDQPFLAGRESVRIEPAFWGARALAAKLKDILTAEGYYAVDNVQTAGAITLLVLDPLNAILVFGPDKAAIEHVVAWAADLDQPGRTGDAEGLFYYKVKNTDAEEIATVISNLMSSDGVQRKTEDTAATPRSSVQRRIVVDKARNAIIFKGSSEEYARLRPLIATMDKAPLEVLIVATVAEVTLTDKDSFGINWALNTAGLDPINTISPRAVGTAGSTGLNFTVFSAARDVRAMLNALASNDNVSILSSPRLVAKSGTQARIQIGTEVPVITATAQQQGSGSTILQQIQYRSTGVILTIDPIIHSGNRVELTVNQEVSEAQVNPTPGIDSPLILNRSITTTLTLYDGETALLGGLISENVSQSDIGVPILKDIPILGHIFKSSSATTIRTELLVLLTPYIIESREEAVAIRDAFQKELSPWASQGKFVDD